MIYTKIHLCSPGCPMPRITLQCSIVAYIYRVPVHDLFYSGLQLTSLELQYVSPKLLMCRDFELCVPGTYYPNQPIINIHHVQSSLQVITSKQRPRKLSIFGQYIPTLGFN